LELEKNPKFSYYEAALTHKIHHLRAMTAAH
jgi:hypothetical protein